MVNLKFKKLNENAIIPEFNREGDAAFDIRTLEDYNLMPGERHDFSTGLATEFPKGYVLLYRDRSGLALKHGIHALAGVIDPEYRGEHKIVLLNTGIQPYKISRGDRIVQGIFIKLPETRIMEVLEFDEESTLRGTGGFGSSGYN